MLEGGCISNDRRDLRARARAKLRARIRKQSRLERRSSAGTAAWVPPYVEPRGETMLIFTSVWGPEYLGYFENGLAMSLRWPKNAEAIKEAHWIVGAQDKSEHGRIRNTIEGMVASYQIVPLELYEGVKYGVRSSFERQVPFLMAPPDNVFSDGSIANFQRIASQKRVCVASAHVRALPSFINDLRVTTPKSASEMVTHAWKHLHDSWTFSAKGVDPSAGHQGGVYTQVLDPQTLAVQHRLPTIFLSNMIQEDVDFFNSQPCLGVWDNIWPPVQLVSQQRYRYLGCSEAGFVVELTHPHRNVPGRQPVNQDEPDSFYGNSLHNWVNREFVSIFKASEPIWS